MLACWRIDIVVNTESAARNSPFARMCLLVHGSLGDEISKIWFINKCGGNNSMKLFVFDLWRHDLAVKLL